MSTTKRQPAMLTQQSQPTSSAATPQQMVRLTGGISKPPDTSIEAAKKLDDYIVGAMAGRGATDDVSMRNLLFGVNPR